MSKKQLSIKPVFVKTRNVRGFEVMMDGLELGAGEGRLGLVYGRAGRGKTRTSQWYASHNECIYLRVATVWRSSELEFLRALCRELGVLEPPHRKGPCFAEIIERLLPRPRPVFIDELEKLPRYFMDVVRDISDMAAAPVILIGEEELVPCMRRNRRVWSRTFRQLEFAPIGIADILVYVREAAGVNLSTEAAGIFHQAAGGDFRIIKRDLLTAVQFANARGADGVDPDTAKEAVRAGLNGNA